MRSAVLAEVGEALDRALGVDPGELSREELADAVLDLQELAAKLAAVGARVVGAFDAEQVWADRGAVNAPTWIRVLAKVSAPNAARQVRHARALRDLPVTSAALAAGAISSDHVTRIVGADNPRTREALRRDEPTIVGWARDLSFQRFCQKLAYWLRANDPDGAEPDAADNRLSLSRTFGGAWRVDGWLDPLTGTVVDSELRRLTDELFQADWRAACERYGTDSPTLDQLGRTPAQRRADALAEMARRSAGMPATHTAARISATVLLGEDSLRQVCELLDGTVLHPADIARWLPISLVQRILYDGLDRPFAASANRSFQGILRKAVQITWRECGHEVCDLPADWCEIDHVLPVHRGGRTAFEQGRPACGHHNRRRTYRDHDPPVHDRWTPHPAAPPPTAA